MITRIAFGEDFGQAIRIRGLTLTELATRAGVTVATASAAVHGRPLNVATATRLARALAAAPVIPELEAWAHAPHERVGGQAAAGAVVGNVALTAIPYRRTGRAGITARGIGQLRMDLR